MCRGATPILIIKKIIKKIEVNNKLILPKKFKNVLEETKKFNKKKF